jgi:hypothetical protein
VNPTEFSQELKKFDKLLLFSTKENKKIGEKTCFRPKTYCFFDVISFDFFFCFYMSSFLSGVMRV